MKTQDFPSRWPARCPLCARRILIELPYGTEAGRTGSQRCPAGHAVDFEYDGVTVRVPGERVRIEPGFRTSPSPLGGGEGSPVSPIRGSRAGRTGSFPPAADWR